MIPNFDELMTPLFRALKSLGGSGKNDEVRNRIIADLNLPDDAVDIPHNENMTELDYRLTWTRTYMKDYGIIVNIKRRVWSITSDYKNVNTLDERDIVKSYRSKRCKSVKKFSDEKSSWHQHAAKALQGMDPYGFERLTQRLLKKFGFQDVQVTKKSGDGGIDGTCRLLVSDIFSFRVAFQCKRYRGSVGAREIRDFRGSLSVNIEKGIMITTGVFSKAAREEASCPGKKPIDLVDGKTFIDKLAQYGLGLSSANVYNVHEDFFQSI